MGLTVGGPGVGLTVGGPGGLGAAVGVSVGADVISSHRLGTQRPETQIIKHVNFKI